MARTIDEIQRDIERTRRQLAGTLEELADRAQPKNLVNDAKTQAAEKLQERNVQLVIAGVAAAVVGLIVLGVSNSRRRSRNLKELQQLLAAR